MEAVKQGSATVGLKSNTHAVLVALKRASSDLASHQEKIIRVDDHIGVSIAGLAADGKSLTRWMRTECMNSSYFHDTPLSVAELIGDLGIKMQVAIQGYNKRPYGVGLLVIGYDGKGAHIYQTCPSANYYECKAMAIGARSQSAKTYLEKCLDKFSGCELDDLIKHGLRALRDTLPNEVELNNKNVSIAVVGAGVKFEVFDDAAVDPYLAGIAGEERRGGDRGAAAAAAAAPGAGEADGGDEAAGEGGEAPAEGMDTD